MFQFFIGSAPEGITVATDIGRYLDFCIKLFFAFGVAFEVPVATFLVVSAGITTVENLRRKRAYVILAAFVVGMLLTPPDMISQTLLALPMWVLFELGLVMCRLYVKSERDAAGEEGEAGGPGAAGSDGRPGGGACCPCTEAPIDWFRPVGAGRDTPPELGAITSGPPEPVEASVQQERFVLPGSGSRDDRRTPSHAT